ncbi:terminase small subunit [Roseateles sp.]|uniref:terminase small subunit n=1 Tax=Roseateles sp. TaxID=1971397 RepID=UPI0032632F68
MDAHSTVDDTMGCTRREAQFVDLYLLLNFNGTQAYTEAGYTARNANVAAVEASRLLRKPKVRNLLGARAKAMVGNIEAEKARLMRCLTAVAYADPRELVAYHRGSCRFCWGKGHRYQFSAGEWDAKMLAFEEREEKAADTGGTPPQSPDTRGGTGYSWNREPHPQCPECYGLGEGRQIIADMRHVSPDVLALFAGIETTSDGGVRVRMHDQMKAREVLAKIYRLVDDAPQVNVAVVSAEALNAIYAEGMRRAQERSAEVRRTRFGETES